MTRIINLKERARGDFYRIFFLLFERIFKIIFLDLFFGFQSIFNQQEFVTDSTSSFRKAFDLNSCEE